MSKTIRTLLIIVLAFLSLSGLGGGIGFVLDPSGENVGVPNNLLDNVPFSTFLIPGLWLLIVYGIGSAVIIYGLVRRQSWAEMAGMLLGVVLIGWIIGQVILWGDPMWLQYLYFVVGVTLVVLGYLARRIE